MSKEFFVDFSFLPGFKSLEVLINFEQKFAFSSKFTTTRQTFTSLDKNFTATHHDNVSEPVCIEPTVSGTRYLFPMNGRISAKELETAANDDEEDSDSSGEDVASDDEDKAHIATARANVFPKIVFLGTGSSFPGVTKTATAILIHTA